MMRRRLEQDLTHALRQAGRPWRRVADAATRPHGVSDATALPPVPIGRLDGEPRRTAFAEAMGVEGPRLVRRLDRPGAAGLVARREDPLDRRAKILSPTPLRVSRAVQGPALREPMPVPGAPVAGPAGPAARAASRTTLLG